MTSLDDLIGKARMLLSDGHSPEQISDELSLSMETVTWLLTQHGGAEAPKDVHIDWTAVSSDAGMLDLTASMMIRRYEIAVTDGQGLLNPEEAGFETVVGISFSGVPMATMIAQGTDSRLAIYHPAKHNPAKNKVGSISGSFAPVTGRQCVIVDDVITTGKTLHEVVDYLRSHGARPVAIWVLFDKRGIRSVEGVPVFSLYNISRID
ncbi:orotate phosphoribosyltransferase-like protein [Methanofollis fontis]|uniref:Transcriptional regulator GfcR n=1 Tax=Methanofollis fontis TaxID=2052832 RepID=A0A483CRM6_9EURY|nr:orotate phosphoribosyltransferase-like protein [Methanofollis fontis]TAJ45773.1 orotate phosphoribosyltransferase-like protein [Methanofollis fontis]